MPGVPLMVIIPVAQEAVTPVGNPVATPMPCTPEVVCVIFGMAVLMQTVGVEEAAFIVGRLTSTFMLSKDVQPPASVTVTL